MTVVGVCCDRCPGASSADSSHVARRRLLKAAVFQRSASADHAGGEDASTIPPGPGDTSHLPRAITGLITDVSPHVVVLGDAHGEQRFTLTADTKAWRGTNVDPADLQPGDEAVIRLLPGRRAVADRIWSNIGRVTGTIVQRTADGLLVDAGHTRQRKLVVIPPRVAGRIQVRFPNLRPGYLIDVIGLRRADYLEGLVPATYQPTYPRDNVPIPVQTAGHLAHALTGTATWHDAADDPHGLLGASYPAVDPTAGCAEIAPLITAADQNGTRLRIPTFRNLPYLAIGSILQVRNDCNGASCALPVTGCAPVARLFNDRCVSCGTTPRGRIVDLTLASYVALGGELDQGCFNATVTIGQ